MHGRVFVGMNKDAAELAATRKVSTTAKLSPQM